MPAQAADMTLAKAAPYAAWNWSGCYIGGNAGAAGADKYFTDPLTVPATDLRSHTASGGFGGGQIGCDVQYGTWVFGLQGMFDGANLRGDHVPFDDRFATRVSWFSTVTARAGMAIAPRFLTYVKAGGAWIRDRHTITDLATGLLEATADTTRSGWTVGFGGEILVAAGWSVFVESDYLRFGTRRIGFTALPEPGDPFPAPFPLDVRQNVTTITAGINYRFGSGPLYAKY